MVGRVIPRVAIMGVALWAIGCGADRAPGPVGPKPLRFASGAFDRARGRLVVYVPSDNVFARPRPEGTWVFEPGGWVREDAFGPVSREVPGVVFDEARSEMVLFGGELVRELETTDETHVYGARQWRRVEASGPTARHSPAMAFDAARGRTLMYGGFGGCVAEECQVLWAFDGAAWRRVE